MGATDAAFPAINRATEVILSKSGFILIPDHITERTDLTATHKLVIGMIARIQGENAVAFPSLDYVAQACGMSRRQVVRVVNDLAARKEIIRVRHPFKSNTYSVPWATARNIRRSWAQKRTA